MKKLLISIFMSAILAGCASTSVTGRDENSTFSLESEEVGVYTRLFENEAAARGLTINTSTLRVYLVDSFSSDLRDAGVVGLCTSQADKKVIYLDKRSLNSYDSLQREMLIFHEFGHCLLDLGHDKSMDMEGVPNDLMFPVNFDSSYYAQYRTFYLDRMFTKVIKRLKSGESDGERKDHACRWGKYKQSKKSTKRPVHNRR